jgi:hypothetical protein
MMEKASTSDTSADIYQTRRRDILEDILVAVRT